MKKSLFRISSVAVLLLLLYRPVLAAAGAKSGLILWSQAVLPVLLPFMIASNVVVALDAIHILTFPFRPLLSHILRLSDSGSYVLVSGLLCGYPMGAKTCSEFIDSGKISVKEGRYLLAICNHASPMFLLGYVASQLPDRTLLTALLTAVYLPILPLAFLAQKYYRIGVTPEQEKPMKTHHLSFDETLMNSCETMVKIGGYIMLFSILAAYLNCIPLPFPIWKASLLGFVEITTGIQAVSTTVPGFSGGLLITVICAFGGLSGIFQTRSVIKNAGLSIRHYITWKGIHGVLSCAIFILLMYLA